MNMAHLSSRLRFSRVLRSSSCMLREVATSGRTLQRQEITSVVAFRAPSYTLTASRLFSSSSPSVGTVSNDISETKKEKEELDKELHDKVKSFSPLTIKGPDLLLLIQELPDVVDRMTGPDDSIPRSIISEVATLLTKYPNNYEVHLPATFEALECLPDLPEVRELSAAVAQKVSKLSRPFSEKVTWTAISSLRDFDSSHPENRALIAAIASRIPTHMTKVDFTPVDPVLMAIAALEGLDSDEVEVQKLIAAINRRLKCKKGKLLYFAKFQDAVIGVRNKSSARPEVRELLHHLVDIKYRFDAFLPKVLAVGEDDEEEDDVVKAKRNPSRYRLDRLSYDDGQEVVDFIRVLGKKTHRYSQFHALYKKNDGERESPYLDVIAHLDLPVHNPMFLKKNSKFIAAHHEAGHIVASHLLPQSPALAIAASIGSLASYTTFKPKDLETMDSKEGSFLDKQAAAMGGLAAEYLFLGAISPSAGNHDFRSVIDGAHEQLTKEGEFLPKDRSKLKLFFRNMKSMLWAISGSFDRGGEKDWVEDHVLEHIEEQYHRVLQLLSENEEMVKKMADTLLEQKALSEEDILRIVADRQIEK